LYPREWDACEGEYKCTGLLSWFVNKNDDLSDTQPRVYRFYRHVKPTERLKLTEEVRIFKPEKSQVLICIQLLYSLDNYAPGYYNYDSKIKISRYIYVSNANQAAVIIRL
jgi:hypothetical protein